MTTWRGAKLFPGFFLLSRIRCCWLSSRKRNSYSRSTFSQTFSLDVWLVCLRCFSCVTSAIGPVLHKVHLQDVPSYWRNVLPELWSFFTAAALCPLLLQWMVAIVSVMIPVRQQSHFQKSPLSLPVLWLKKSFQPPIPNFSIARFGVASTFRVFFAAGHSSLWSFLWLSKHFFEQYFAWWQAEHCIGLESTIEAQSVLRHTICAIEAAQSRHLLTEADFFSCDFANFSLSRFCLQSQQPGIRES